MNDINQFKATIQENEANINQLRVYESKYLEHEGKNVMLNQEIDKLKMQLKCLLYLLKKSNKKMKNYL